MKSTKRLMILVLTAFLMLVTVSTRAAYVFAEENKPVDKMYVGEPACMLIKDLGNPEFAVFGREGDWEEPTTVVDIWVYKSTEFKIRYDINNPEGLVVAQDTRSFGYEG